MLSSTLREFFSQQPQKNFLIAFSGGLDSHVLLDLCVKLRAEFSLNLKAIHINHNISPHAKAWVMHCAQICKTYGVDFITCDLSLNLAAGDSFEEVAREKRYVAFANYVKKDNVLLTAHHADDQAETLLLQLLRGAGPKGLAAMPAIKKFGEGFHARPLLNITRDDILQYAVAEKLIWIEDESNANTQLTRNFLRHDILPLLKKRWPTIALTLSRSAKHCAETQLLLENFAQDYLTKVRGSRADTLSVKKLLQLDQAKQALLLRTWITNLNYPLPDSKKMQTILQNVLTAKIDRKPCVQFQTTEIRRYGDDLFLLPAIKKPNRLQSFTWDLADPLIIPDIGELKSMPVQGQGLREVVQQVAVRFRQEGEVVELYNRGCHTLKKLFQEWRIPPWERDHIPLIFWENKLIAAVGYFLEPKIQVEKDEVGREIVLRI